MDRANVKLARRFFFLGLACLPWLWLVNLFYFRSALCSERASPELRSCERMAPCLMLGRWNARLAPPSASTSAYLARFPSIRLAGLKRSAIGAVVFTVIFIAWVVFIQLSWQAIGAQDVLVTTPDTGALWWLDNS